GARRRSGSRRSLAAVQLATQDLHSALDQPCRGGTGPAETDGDVGQRPALQVAQPDRFALIVGERRERLAPALGLLPGDGLLAWGGDLGIESLLQGRPAAVRIVDRLLPAHTAFLEQGVVADRGGDLVVQNPLEPGDEFAGITAGELRETAIRFEKG